MERKRSVRRRAVYRKPLGEQIKDYARNIIAFLFSNVGIIGLVVGYTIAGAFMFIAIEEGNARDLTSDVLAMRRNVTDKLWDLTCCQLNLFNHTAWSERAVDQLHEYEKYIIKAVKNGYDGIDDPEESKQWRFSGAFLYSLTVITTIGYGNIAPRTKWGKVATIFYAIIGMPLFLLYLSNIGDLLARSFKWTYSMCCLCRGCPGVARRRADRLKRQAQQSQYLENKDSIYGIEELDEDLESMTEVSLSIEEYDPQSVTVPITLCLTIMVSYMVFGAVLFGNWESWDYIDGSYFSFISLSSIGFGDIVPGNKIFAAKKIDLSFIFCSMYLMLGMALIAMCFNLMQEQVIYKMGVGKRILKRLFKCSR